MQNQAEESSQGPPLPIETTDVSTSIPASTASKPVNLNLVTAVAQSTAAATDNLQPPLAPHSEETAVTSRTPPLPELPSTGTMPPLQTADTVITDIIRVDPVGQVVPSRTSPTPDKPVSVNNSAIVVAGISFYHHTLLL